jgi:hypothetical protein
MGLRLRNGNVDRLDMGSLDGNGVILILKNAVHTQKLFSVDHDIHRGGIHDHIRNSRFIFKTQKDEVFGGSQLSLLLGCRPKENVGRASGDHHASAGDKRRSSNCARRHPV